jgi:hypothetical protein
MHIVILGAAGMVGRKLSHTWHLGGKELIALSLVDATNRRNLLIFPRMYPW